jgi:hypothetical protein
MWSRTRRCVQSFFLCKLKASSINYIKTFLDRFPLDFPATADNMLFPSAHASSGSHTCCWQLWFPCNIVIHCPKCLQLFEHRLESSFHKMMYFCINFVSLTMKCADPGDRAVLTRRSTAAWLLGSRVWIPLRIWIFIFCVCYVLYG